MERVSQAYEFSHSNFIIEQHATFTLMNKKVYMDLWNMWGRGGGVASAPVAPPLPMGLAFVNDFFTI